MRKNRSSHLAHLLWSVGAFATAATAQVSSTPSTNPDLAEVVVTGSRISRTDTETPAPVQVISAEDLKQSGYTTVSEVLRNLTANGQGTLSNAFPGAFAGGATGISLRGLNTSATLVLIDGHRMAPFALSDDGQRSFVDISSIPFDAVERIEVLKDGASAAYGSDAMAGVVNVILKKKYVGTAISGEVGNTTEGGGFTDHFTVMHGMGDLDADGYNAYINLEYRRQNSITYNQREGRGLWSDLNQTNQGGIDQTPGVFNPFRPIPPTYGTVYLTPLSTGYGPNNQYYANPLAPNAAYKGTCTYALQQTGGCGFTSPYYEVQPNTKNYNGIASVKKKLGDDWLLDVKASWFKSVGEQVGGGSSAMGLVTYPTAFNPNIGVSAQVLPHAVGTTIAAVTVPATYPGNFLGEPAKVRGVNLDGGYAHTDFTSDSYRIAADLAGTVLGWTVDTSLGWSQEITKQSNFGATDVPVLDALLNSPTNPWLITGGNSAANVAAVFPANGSIDTSTLMYAEVDVSRSLFALPGGDLGVSMGAQYITRKLNSPAPELVAEGIVSGNNAFVLGDQTDAAAFAEIVAPVLSMLELDAQARFDHFNVSGNATTPSIGFKFKPLKQFAIRGTYGLGFRAPNPAENGNAGQAYSAGTASDPILCPNGDPTAAGAVISQCKYNVIYENSTNANLKPEKSHSLTFGVIFEPFSAWSSTLDYYQVKIDNQIVAGTPNVAGTVRGAPISETCSDGAGGTVPCTTSVGEIVYVPVAYVNANSSEVRGAEFTTKYTFDAGIVGKFTLDADWSHTISYLYSIQGQTFELAGSHGPAVIGGDTGNPKNRVQADIVWNKGPAEFKTTFNWISSFDLTDASGSNFGGPSALIANGIETADCAGGVQNGGTYIPWFAAGQPTNPKYCRVQQFLDVDMYAGYHIGDHLTVHASVLNVFNQQPPVDYNTYGGINTPYNPSMHQAGAVGRFVNIGARYEF